MADQRGRHEDAGVVQAGEEGAVTIGGEATRDAMELLITLGVLIAAMGIMVGWYGRG